MGLHLSLKNMVIKECRVRGVKPEDIADNEPVIGGQGLVQLDSLDAVEVVTCLERHLGIKAEGMKLKNIFRSYTELAAFIEANAAKDKIAAFVETYHS
jgi:acyl carrier protein